MNKAHTPPNAADPAKRSHRSYPAAFKIQVVHECRQRGASVADVALRHGINANIVHRWLHEFDRGHFQAAQVAQPGFVPVLLDAPASADAAPAGTSASTAPPGHPSPGAYSGERDR